MANRQSNKSENDKSLVRAFVAAATKEIVLANGSGVPNTFFVFADDFRCACMVTANLRSMGLFAEVVLRDRIFGDGLGTTWTASGFGIQVK